MLVKFVTNTKKNDRRGGPQVFMQPTLKQSQSRQTVPSLGNQSFEARNHSQHSLLLATKAVTFLCEWLILPEYILHAIAITQQK